MHIYAHVPVDVLERQANDLEIRSFDPKLLPHEADSLLWQASVLRDAILLQEDNMAQLDPEPIEHISEEAGAGLGLIGWAAVAMTAIVIALAVYGYWLWR